MKARYVEGKWLNEEELIDFLIERVFLLQARIQELELHISEVKSK